MAPSAGSPAARTRAATFSSSSSDRFTSWLSSRSMNSKPAAAAPRPGFTPVVGPGPAVPAAPAGLVQAPAAGARVQIRLQPRRARRRVRLLRPEVEPGVALGQAVLEPDGEVSYRRWNPRQP